MRPLEHVLRRLGWAPFFTTIALVTLALGIGANTAIFSVINSVLLKPLAYPQADLLVGVWHTAPGVTGLGGQVNCSPTMYFTYREERRTFQNIGFWNAGGASVTGLAEPEQPRALTITYGLLDALGIAPKMGRWFSQADDTPGSPETVILTYGYWQKRFAGDASVVGRTLTIDSRPHTVIGVMPEDFQFRNDPSLILPMRFDRNKVFLGNFSYQGIARLKPGTTLEQANADVTRMLPIWLEAWPTPPGFSREIFKNARFGAAIQPLKREVVGDIGPVLWVLMGTIGLVLLIACANVANLLLVRAEGRQQELAIRAALGAGWGRIAREMLLESVTLSVAGGALGLGLAYAALRVLVAKGPTSLPRLNEIAIDPVALAFTLGVSLLTGLLFGLIPVFKYARRAVARFGPRRRTIFKRRPRTASRPQYAGRRASRAGAGAADRLRTHAAHLPSPAPRATRIHKSRGDPAHARVHSARAGERTRARHADAAGDARQAGYNPRRDLSSVHHFRSHGRLQQQRSSVRRRQELRRRTDSAHPPLPQHHARIFKNCRHADDRRPRFQLV